MSAAVRVPDHVLVSVRHQLDNDQAAAFLTLDLPEAVAALAAVDWWTLPEIAASPGTRRFTIEAGRAVAGFHLLVGLDPWSEDAGGLVVHVIDIWPERWHE